MKRRILRRDTARNLASIINRSLAQLESEIQSRYEPFGDNSVTEFLGVSTWPTTGLKVNARLLPRARSAHEPPCSSEQFDSPYYCQSKFLYLRRS
jgi:hypothetical protein